MKQNEFRELQRKLDDLGVTTAIIKSGRHKARRYEVIANGELKKKYKTRYSAKNLIINLHKSLQQ